MELEYYLEEGYHIMNENIKNLCKEMELNLPTAKEIIEEVQNKFGIRFPKQYFDFMLFCNGGEGSIGHNSYLVIWPIEQLVDLNKAYAVSDFTPGLIYFGSDGGDMAYAFDAREESFTIVEFPFESIKIDDAKLCGNTVDEFLKYLYNS